MSCQALRRLLTLVPALALAAPAASQQPAAKPAIPPAIVPNQAHLAQTLTGLDGPGTACVYSEATGILAAASEHGTIVCWPKDVTAGVRSGNTPPIVLPGHKGRVTALACGGGTVLASAGVDQKIRLWDMAEGKILHTFATATIVRALTMSGDGKLLAAAGDDSVIQLWDVATGTAGIKLAGHADWVLCLAFSPDDKLLASAGYDQVFQLWDVAGTKKLLDIPVQPPAAPSAPKGSGNTVRALAFSADNKQLAWGGTDAQIHLVNVADGKFVRSFAGHDGSVTSLAFHPSGTLLVSGSKDRTVRLWNPANGQLIKNLEGHTAWVESVVLIAGGTRLASVGADAAVHLWDLK